MNAVVKLNDEVSNAAKGSIAQSEPWTCDIRITGTADLLLHRWSNEAVAAKASARKGSAQKKTDDLESYVYRDERGQLALPGEYLRMSMVHAAKFRQDPRSPRKSAMDLFKAGIVSLTALASLGVDRWDYEDSRRVVVQRNGITRVRPAMRHGYHADFTFMVLVPEYIDEIFFREVLVMAGRLVGIGNFRPTYGRFDVTSFKRR